MDQDALGTSHSHAIISECDGEECCPGPHCTKDLICRHGHDCYYVPHKKVTHHYSTYHPAQYYDAPIVAPPPPPRRPVKHRPYNPLPKPRPISNLHSKPRPTKTKPSSHYASKPNQHQGNRPNQVRKPAASNVVVFETKKPASAPLKHGSETGAIASFVEEGIVSTIPRDGKKEKFKKLKKKKFLKKYMMPLLMAYKMMFMVAVPVMVKTMMMVVSSSGFTGFFVALFGAAVTFHYYHSRINAAPTSITMLSSSPPPTEPTKVMKVIKYLPVPQPMPQPILPPPPQHPPLPPPPPPTPPQSPQYPEEPYGGYHYPNPNYYPWMDRRKAKKRKRNNKGSTLPSLSLFA